MKRIAFTTTGNNLVAELDPRFSRTKRFLVYDLEQQQVSLLENRQSRATPLRAGARAVEAVAGAGVEALVTGRCCPRTYRALQAAGIQVYRSSAATVKDALSALQSGALKPLTAADLEGRR